MELKTKTGSFCLHILLGSLWRRSEDKVIEPLGTPHTMLHPWSGHKRKKLGWKLALKPTKRTVLQHLGWLFFFFKRLFKHKIVGDKSCSEWNDFSWNNLVFLHDLMISVTQMGLCGCHKTPSKSRIGEQRCSTVLLKRLLSGSGCQGETCLTEE